MNEVMFDSIGRGENEVGALSLVSRMGFCSHSCADESRFTAIP